MYINQIIEDFKAKAYYQEEFKEISLSDYLGKWVVLLFYPVDFTFICPTELKEAAEQHKEFQKNGAEILSISTDSIYSHKAWHDTSSSVSQIKYPMLSDASGRISKYFGTYIEEEGISVRATFMIDPEGRLKYMELHDNSIGRNLKETFRKFLAAKYVTKHSGEVCPASWMPGEKTLKPGVDLVGKI
jgi:NADH-dependent peroxiredoxin subunit C